jgi:hypothetical protein
VIGPTRAIGTPALHVPGIVCPACKMIIDLTTGVPGGDWQIPDELPKDITFVMVCGGCESVLGATPSREPTERVTALPKQMESMLRADLRASIEQIRRMVRAQKAAGRWPSPRYAQ